MRNCFKFTSVILFIFIFVTPSFAILTKSEDFKNKEIPENYTAILIQLPNVINQPSVWNEKFSMPAKDIDLASYGGSMANKLTELSGESVDEIASAFNGTVFFNNSDYSYAYISVPDEQYGNLTEALKLLGFDVKNVSWGRAMLYESRQEIGLPYVSPSTGQNITGEGRKIAIIDTGLDAGHQDFWVDNTPPLNNKVIFWNDIIDGTQCCIDSYGHGTHVASIAAGTGAAFYDIYKGIAPDAQLLIFRASRLGEMTLGDLATAINSAVDQNPDVISVSFGWSDEKLLSDYNVAMADACTGTGTNDIINVFNAIQNAINSGIPVVFAAGNEGPESGSIDFPACINNVIAVGMTFKKDYSSNYYSYLTGLDATMARALFHVNADASGESLDKEWYVYNTTGEDLPDWMNYLTWTGFTKVFSTANPELNLNIEGQYKKKDCYAADQITWNPGSSDKGDDFWTWTNYVAPYGGIEVFGRDHTNWGSCPLYDVWGTTYVNSFPCTGTPKSCNDFDTYKDGCENQAGCNWCGCFVWTVYPIVGYCKDVSMADCPLYSPSEWRGCEGTATSCEERNNKEEECGTTSTTGCSGQWILDDTIVRVFSTKNPSLKGLPAPDSSRGPTANGLTKPDVTAPGVDVCAARATGTTMGDLDCGNNDYVRASGTSMAAPMVAGEIALLKEINPTATYDQILNSVKYGSDILITYIGESSENHRGLGRINITKAADSVTDCAFEPSYDTGDSGNDPLEPGNCFDYTIWSNTYRSCAGTTYNDYCSGKSLYEYYADGFLCSAYLKNCEDYENPPSYYCNSGSIYKREWGCWGSPGRCLDSIAPDTLYQKCYDSCSDTDSGINNYVKGTVTKKSLCSSGMTSCPSDEVKTDTCLSDVVQEKTCDIFTSGLIYKDALTTACAAYCPTGTTPVLTCIGSGCTSSGWGWSKFDFNLCAYDDFLDESKPGCGGASNCHETKCTCKINPNTLREYYCSGNNYDYSDVICRTDAAETDKGQQFLIQGTCTKYTGCSEGACQRTTYKDSCVDSNVLREYYVSGSGDSATCSYTDYDCKNLGSNYSCFSGRCANDSGSGGGGGGGPFPLLGVRLR
jgi:subtilisin family serine protease